MAKRKPHELPRIQLRRGQAPSQLGGAVGGYLPPGAQYDYKPPSVFAEYKVLSVIFALIVLAALLYWAFWPTVHQPHPTGARPASASPPPQAPDSQGKADPVYVEPIVPR